MEGSTIQKGQGVECNTLQRGGKRQHCPEGCVPPPQAAVAFLLFPFGGCVFPSSSSWGGVVPSSPPHSLLLCVVLLSFLLLFWVYCFPLPLCFFFVHKKLILCMFLFICGCKKNGECTQKERGEDTTTQTEEERKQHHP